MSIPSGAIFTLYEATYDLDLSLLQPVDVDTLINLLFINNEVSGVVVRYPKTM